MGQRGVQIPLGMKIRRENENIEFLEFGTSSLMSFYLLCPNELVALITLLLDNRLNYVMATVVPGSAYTSSSCWGVKPLSYSIPNACLIKPPETVSQQHLNYKAIPSPLFVLKSSS